ncbi:MAG: Ppx/GppA family phosphatase [Sphingobacteriia bacterium]|nr:Ppx/GppA family phosphatase [Sphingobacteriia bacterium]
MEQIAIIDLGTNTFHLLIVEVNDREEFTVKDKFKDPVKLGEGGITQGYIAKEAFERGQIALEKFRKIINTRQVSRVFAFATSAIRGAKNGIEFIQLVEAKTGIKVQVINGNEEAALIFQGVKNAVSLPPGQDCLLVDIGGGSVEFIVARDGKIRLLRSLDLGAARLLEQLKIQDPINPSEIEQARKLIQQVIGPLIEELKAFSIRLLVGSSGTFETLATLIAYENRDFHSLEHINGYRFDQPQFQQIFQKLLILNKAGRTALPGMDINRVDLIVLGSILVDEILQSLNLEQILLSTYALKEGILYDYIETRRQAHLPGLIPGDRKLRERSVRNLGAKLQFDEPHAVHVASLAVSLLDQLEELTGTGEEERELLLYASMLHDIGHFLNRSGHHKHGQYFVLNSGLPGFSNDELLIMSNVVRYHRKSLPTRDHLHFALLHPTHKMLVRQLSGILRIADNLDRGHRHLVESIKLEVRSALISIEVKGPSGLEIEIQAALDNRELFEQVFERRLQITQA